MHHGTELAVVILFSMTLAVGSVLRLLSGVLKVPYTIAMLMLGLACGIALGWPALGFQDRMAAFTNPEFHPHTIDYVLQALGSGLRVQPDLIMFCFLPALVFESAFAIDLHTFKKTVGPAIVFAGPAMLVATALSGGLLYVLLPFAGWDWDGAFVAHGAARGTIIENGALLAALFFGALISATDPVAVVALLRDLGVNKKLAHLIEGESLLNDGTAIVVSGVMLELVVGQPFGGVGSTSLHFVVVVAGGLLVGWLLALATAWILGRTFNDPLVEITATLVLGYMAMWVAEGMLHVSGVMALVAAGLWMGGPARTTVSPEVAHFLHQFWELLAHMANTLIFFLVGLIIGHRFQDATIADFGLILAVYVGIMVIRFVVTAAFRPMADRFGDPISGPDVLIVSWGGLRGAVAMALVLALATNEMVPEVVSQKMLLLTAGVVLLSIAVNGMTMGTLLSRLGYDAPPIGEAMAAVGARAAVLDRVRQAIESMRSSRELRTVRWNEVVDSIEARRSHLAGQRDALRADLEKLPIDARAGGIWSQVLGIEREAYWHAFSHGTLSSRAVKVFDHEINSHFDAIAKGNLEPPESRVPTSASLRRRMTRMLRETEAFAGLYANVEFENLALHYDLLRGMSSAAAKVLGALGGLEFPSLEAEAAVRRAYQRYQADGKQGLEEMRVGLPEITAAIETRIAERIAMNLEREQLLACGHSGVLSEVEATRLAAEVEERMARLATAATRARLPELGEMVAEIPLFEGLSAPQLERIAAAARVVVLPAGDLLFRQRDRGDAMFFIVRGAVHITITDDAGVDRSIDVLGGGDILGEMALLTGEPRTASALCATAVTLVRLGRDAFESAIADSAELADACWGALARRRLDNHVRTRRPWQHLEHGARTNWFGQGRLVALEDGQVLACEAAARWAFVVVGGVSSKGVGAAAVGTITAPGLVDLRELRPLVGHGATRVLVLPDLPAEQAAA